MENIATVSPRIILSTQSVKAIIHSWWNACMFLWVLLYFIPISQINGLFLPPYIPVQYIQYIVEPYFNLWEDFFIQLFGHKSLIGSGGSSDTELQYFCLIASPIFAAIIAFIWALAAHFPFAHKLPLSKITSALRFIWHNGLRLCLASTMIAYGLMKAIPVQMPVPYPTELITHIGDQVGMAYLWNWIGFSPVMEILCGLAEFIGGILLLIPRFIILGGYINLAMMGLVGIFVFCYDVPVKTFVIYVFIGEFILLFPSLREFYHYFIQQKAIDPPQYSRIITTQKIWLRRPIIVVYILLFGQFTLACTITFWAEHWEEQLNPHIPINGRWLVESDKSINPGFHAIYADKWMILAITALNQDNLAGSSYFSIELNFPHEILSIPASYTSDTIQLATHDQKLLPYDLLLKYYVHDDILTLTAQSSHNHQPGLIITAKRAPRLHHPGEFHWRKE